MFSWILWDGLHGQSPGIGHIYGTLIAHFSTFRGLVPLHTTRSHITWLKAEEPQSAGPEWEHLNSATKFKLLYTCVQQFAEWFCLSPSSTQLHLCPNVPPSYVSYWKASHTNPQGEVVDNTMVRSKQSISWIIKLSCFEDNFELTICRRNAFWALI